MFILTNRLYNAWLFLNHVFSFLLGNRLVSVPKSKHPKIPASITGHHNPDSLKVVFRHLFLWDNSYQGPLRGHRGAPASEVKLRDVLELLWRCWSVFWIVKAIYREDKRNENMPHCINVFLATLSHFFRYGIATVKTVQCFKCCQFGRNQLWEAGQFCRIPTVLSSKRVLGTVSAWKISLSDGIGPQ